MNERAKQPEIKDGIYRFKGIEFEVKNRPDGRFDVQEVYGKRRKTVMEQDRSTYIEGGDFWLRKI